MDATIPAPLGKVYSLIFGPSSGVFMKKFLIDDQKSLELTLEDDKTGLGGEKKTRGYSYIKPLTGSFGPKQTKCIIVETLEQENLEKAVTVACATQNPDVPSGNVFVVKTKYCLMWAPGNSTRMIITGAIEWSGKSWIKGTLTATSQTQFIAPHVFWNPFLTCSQVPSKRAQMTAKRSMLKTSLRLYRRPSQPKAWSRPPASKAKKGSKRRKEADDAPSAPSSGGTGSKSQQEPNWGLFEPVRGLLEPITSMIGTGPIIAILCVLVAFLLFRQPSSSAGGVGFSGLHSPQRLAAYEQMWAGEEAEAWAWLEERVGLHGAAPAMYNVAEDSAKKLRKRQQREKEMAHKVQSTEMSDKQIFEAVRATKERLDALEAVVQRRSAKEPIVGGNDAPIVEQQQQQQEPLAADKA